MHPDEGMRPVVGYMVALFVGLVIVAVVPWISIGCLQGLAATKDGRSPGAPALAFKAARSATAGSSARHARCGGRVRGTAGQWRAPGRHPW
ncbi:hypothetical protein [Paracoccus yeei]|uniref:hypothetical protein n=1 Tax=Paracoccus yeei TaxID=147645 RepID=UPI003BF8A5B6